MGKGKQKFGFLGIKGPKEKMFGGRRPNESRKEWKQRIAREADLGSVANKENLTKRDILKVGEGGRNAQLQAPNRPPVGIAISRDMKLVAAVDAIEDDFLGLAGDVTSMEARIVVLESVQDEGDAVISGMGTSLGNIIGILDPIIAGINAADVPTIPLAAQAGYALTVWSANMEDGQVFGLGKPAVRTLAFFLRVVAYYDADVGFTSLFQTDSGGLFGSASTATVASTATEIPDLF